MKLLDLSPTARALTAEPFTATEIDAHPDADRIWATLLLAKEATERAYDNGFADGERYMGQYA